MRATTAQRRLVTAATAWALLSVAASYGIAGRAAEPVLKHGGSELLNAVVRDDLQAVTGLITRRVDVNTKGDDGATPLAWSIMRSNAEIAEKLLAAGANPNAANLYGVTPLHLAIANQSPVLLELLLSKDANPNLARDSGETPLMGAVRTGRTDLVKPLLAHKADVNARDIKFGQTALMWAAGHPEVTRLLIDAGADLKVVTNSWEVKAAIPGQTFRTIGATGVPWVFDGDYTSKKGGQNALMFAIQKRDIESVRMLLDAGLDVNGVSADNTTPLLLSIYKWESTDGRAATFAPDVPTANLLLDRGAKIAVADDQGYTPLHGAVMAASSPAAVQGRAPANRGGQQRGRTAAPGAARGGGGGGRGGGVPAPRPGNPEAIQLVTRLLDGQANPNARVIYPTVGIGRLAAPPSGSTPLHIAVGSRNVELVRALLNRGGNPNLARKDGLTPFALAVQADDLEVVKEFVTAGADLTMRYNPTTLVPDTLEAIALSRQNQTIMHLAAIAGSPKSIEYLFSIGAPLTLKNAQDETPLEMADHQEVFNYILAYEGTGAGGGIWRPREFATSDMIRRLLGQRTMAEASDGTVRTW